MDSYKIINLVITPIVNIKLNLILDAKSILGCDDVFYNKYIKFKNYFKR